MPRIFDSFLLFNEIDLLLLRLETLYDVVDTFCIVECGQSHGGIDKPFFFEIYKDRFKKYLHKIQYYKLPELPPLRDSSLEARTEIAIFNYNKQLDAVRECGPSPDDIVIVSDLDEIPDPLYVEKLPYYLRSAPHVVFVQTFYRSFVNRLQDFMAREWAGCVACRYRQLEAETAMGIRRGQEYPRSAHLLYGTRRPGVRYFENAGWHFSYFGGLNAERVKYRNSLEALGDLSLNQVIPLVDMNYNSAEWRAQEPELVEWIKGFSPSIIPLRSYSEVPEKFPNLPDPLLKNPAAYSSCFWLDLENGAST